MLLPVPLSKPFLVCGNERRAREPERILSKDSKGLDFGLMGLFGNPDSSQELEEGEDGFLTKSNPFGSLGEECENGLALVGLAMGLRGEGEEGVEGVEEMFEESPNWVLAFRMRACRYASDPKAKRIKSFSPRSCIRRYPMIFEAFSGSKNFIFENTTFVASKGSMASGVCGFGSHCKGRERESNNENMVKV